MPTALAVAALCAAFAAAPQQDPGSAPAPAPHTPAGPSPAAVPQPSSQSEPAPKITDKLKADAASLAPIVSSSLAKDFLAATARLSEPTTRTVYRNREKGTAVSAHDYESMSADARTGFAARECSPEFYFETGYGSPLVYARVIDLAAPHLAKGAPPKVLDYGYGSIGQLQLLAHCGFDAHGVDIEPLFPALYSEPGDTGSMGKGSVAIHTGRWPADEALKGAIGGGYALITSKNTLKNGYVHPSPPAGQTVDPKRLLQLGVSDEVFVAQVHAALNPGGVLVIYNICPPQNPPDKEYIPYADGTSPFSREMLEKAGFEVLAFDARDEPWVLDCFERLGYSEGKPREELSKDYFCWYTIARRRP
jgi:hypothetical protein